MKRKWQGLIGLLVLPLLSSPAIADNLPPPPSNPAVPPGGSLPGNATPAPAPVLPSQPGAPAPGAPATLPDYTTKINAKTGMELTFSIHDGIDTHRKPIGDYQFTAIVEPKAPDCALSYKWTMSPPAEAAGIRAISRGDLHSSKETSFFYQDKQECTLDGFTSILRVSDYLYQHLKAGLDSGFGSDGPDVVMVNHKAERPAPTTIHKVGQEQVEITVNNKQVEVNTIKAIADNGWQYWILDNARFPLMVKGDGPIRWDAPTIIVDETPEPTPKASKNEGKRIVNDLKKKGIATTRSILFDFDSAKLKPSAKPILNELIGYLKSDGKVGLSIEGHTDNVGGYDYNIKLSQRRANAVRDYLLKTGHVNLSRFKSKGYGYTKPVASNKTAAGRALNRRVVFVKL